MLTISCAASVVLSVLTLRNLGDATTLLPIWIGIGLFARGVSTTSSAISDRELPGRGGNLIFGLLSLVAGLAVIAPPIKSIATLAIVVGVWLVLVGFAEIVAAFGMRRAIAASQVTVGRAVATD
jgi:uncharacterized membrane protein HdeD (DUF308 family)